MIGTIIRCARCEAQHLRPASKHADRWFVDHARNVHGMEFARTRAEQRRRWFEIYISQYEDYIAERRAA